MSNYSFTALFNQAFALGLNHLKFKKGDRGFVLTAPPCYHVENLTAQGCLFMLVEREKARQNNRYDLDGDDLGQEIREDAEN